jgi:hypothetical protein
MPVNNTNVIILTANIFKAVRVILKKEDSESTLHFTVLITRLLQCPFLVIAVSVSVNSGLVRFLYLRWNGPLRGRDDSDVSRPRAGDSRFLSFAPLVPSAKPCEVDPVFSYAIRENPFGRSQPPRRFTLVAASLLQGGNDDVFFEFGDRALEKIVVD